MKGLRTLSTENQQENERREGERPQRDKAETGASSFCHKL